MRLRFPLQDVPDADNEIGIVIFSKHPLADARPIPNHMKGACGVWASTIIATICPIAAGFTAEEEREACRALKGSMLRQEVYADDAGPNASAGT